MKKKGVLLAAIGVLVLAGAGAYWWRAQVEAEREARRALERVPAAEVGLEGLKFIRNDIGGLTLTGKVRNRSKKFTLRNVVLEIAASDCAKGKCVAVAKMKRRVDVEVPPGQVVYFERKTSLPDMKPPRGTRRWDYRVVGTRAD